MRYAICNETFERATWPECCTIAAELGYDGLELAPFTFAADVTSITAPDRRAISQAATGTGLAIAGLHWLLVSPPGMSLTSDDGQTRERTSQYMVDLVRFCADVGGTVMVLGSPMQRRLPDRPSHDEAVRAARDRLCAVLAPAVDLAERSEVTLCLEPLPAPEADFIMTMCEAVALVEAFNSRAVRTILDIKSASAETDDPASLYRRYAHLIAHVHANDANRKAPGMGDTDFEPILEALLDDGYDGWVSVEVFDLSPSPQSVAATAIATLRAAERAARR